jgi:hypothetical protein
MFFLGDFFLPKKPSHSFFHDLLQESVHPSLQISVQEDGKKGRKQNFDPWLQNGIRVKEASK